MSAGTDPGQAMSEATVEQLREKYSQLMNRAEIAEAEADTLRKTITELKEDVKQGMRGIDECEAKLLRIKVEKIKLAGEHTPSEDVVPSTDRKGSIHELQDPGNPSLEDVMSVMLSEQSSQEFKANVCRAYLVAVEEKSAKQRLLGGMKVSVDGEKTGNGMASREGSGDGEIDDLPTTPKTTTALNRSVNLNGSGMVRIEENTTRGRDREAQATRPSATPTSRPPFGPLADKIQHPRQTTPSTVAGQKRAHSDFREPICVSCWRTGTPCDRRPQCRSCIDRGMLCVHMRCSGHSNCKNENCPHLHPAQYDERDSRWDVRNGELPGYKGQSSRYAEKRQKY